MAKQERKQAADVSAEAAEAVDISAADHTFANRIQGLYVGGAGDVIVRLRGDDADVTFKAVPVGTVLPICPSKVVRTGTTATFMVGLI